MPPTTGRTHVFSAQHNRPAATHQRTCAFTTEQRRRTLYDKSLFEKIHVCPLPRQLGPNYSSRGHPRNSLGQILARTTECSSRPNVASPQDAPARRAVAADHSVRAAHARGPIKKRRSASHVAFQAAAEVPSSREFQVSISARAWGLNAFGGESSRCKALLRRRCHSPS